MAVTEKNCFQKNGRDDLSDLFKDKVKGGMSEKQAAREVIVDAHEKLHNDMEELKGSVIKNYKPESYKRPDNTQALKDINDKYDKQINDLNKPPEKPPVPAEEKISAAGEENKTGIKNAISQETRQRLNLPSIELPQIGTDYERLQKGKVAVESGEIDPEEVVSKVLEGKGEIGMQPKEAAAMQYYMHQLGRADELLQEQLALDLEPKEKIDIIGQRQQLNDLLERATEANQLAGTPWSEVGHTRQILVDKSFNPSRERSFIKDAYGGEIPSNIKAELDKTIQERDEAVQARTKLEEELRQKEAEVQVAKMKSGRTPSGSKTDYAAKRKGLLEDLKKAKEEHEQWLKDNGIQKQGTGFTLTGKMIKIIGEYAKTFIDQGAEKLSEVIDKVYEELKDLLPGIDKKSIRDAIALHESGKLEKKAEGLEKKIESGDIQPIGQKLKAKFQNDNRWVKANQKVYNAESKIRKMKSEALESQKNMFQKAFMWGSKLIRFSYLSGVNVLYKLASAATIGGLLKRPIEQGFGVIWSNIYKGIGRKAPIEGFPNVKAEMKFMKEFLDPAKFVKNTWEIAKTHSSFLNKKMGENYYDDLAEITMPGKQKTLSAKAGKVALNVADRTLTLPMDVHQMIKDPVKRSTYEASMVNGMAWAEKNGLDINDPLIRNVMEVASYKRANYEIFQEKRWLSKKFNEWKNEIDKSGTGGSAAKLLVDFMIPVSTVPTNIAARLLSTSPLGMIRGQALVINAYRKGIENLSNEQADAVMRQLKQGSLGTALWMIGWFGASHFGGLYSQYNPNKKRKGGELKSDQMEVDGKMIPKPVQHAIPLEVIQTAATARRIYDSYVGKKAGTLQSILNAGLGTIGAVAEQIPVVETPAHIIGATHDPYEGKKLQEDMQRRFEPQGLKEMGVISKPTKKPKMRTQ